MERIEIEIETVTVAGEETDSTTTIGIAAATAGGTDIMIVTGIVVIAETVIATSVIVETVIATMMMIGIVVDVAEAAATKLICFDPLSSRYCRSGDA